VGAKIVDKTQETEGQHEYSNCFLLYNDKYMDNCSVQFRKYIKKGGIDGVGKTTRQARSAQTAFAGRR